MKQGAAPAALPHIPVTVNKSLKFQTDGLFQDKVDKANEMLRTAKLPKTSADKPKKG